MVDTIPRLTSLSHRCGCKIASGVRAARIGESSVGNPAISVE